MHRYRFLLFLILISLSILNACSSGTAIVEGENWVIFPEDYAKSKKFGAWIRPENETIEYWTPSEADILALESGLYPYLQTNQALFYLGVPTEQELNSYFRQYMGLLVKGDKFIYANYFCRETSIDWKKELVFVMDGGACFFQFKHDPEENLFFDLRVNGEA